MRDGKSDPRNNSSLYGEEIIQRLLDAFEILMISPYSSVAGVPCFTLVTCQRNDTTNFLPLGTQLHECIGVPLS